MCITYVLFKIICTYVYMFIHMHVNVYEYFCLGKCIPFKIIILNNLLTNEIFRIYNICKVEIKLKPLTFINFY